MKTKGIFISSLLVIDTFFVSYAAGFHSRHVLVINPKLPPVVQKTVDAKPTTAVVPPKKTDPKDTHSKQKHPPKSHETKPSAKAGEKPAGKAVAKPAAKQTTKSTTKPATAKPRSAHLAKPASNSPGA